MIPPERILTEPSPAELLHAIAEHPHGLLDAMSAIPGSSFHSAPELTWYTTPVVSPMFAGVMRINIGSAVVDAAIERVSSQLESTGAPYAFWWIGPETRPADLGERLIAHGLSPWDVDAPGMAVQIDDAVAPADLPAGLSVKRVSTPSQLQDWKAAFVDGMEVPEFAGQAWVDATTQIGIERAGWRLFVGYLDGDPVAVAGTIGVAGVASVFAVATASRARRKGIGGAMTVTALRYMRQHEGYRWGVLFSSAPGLSVYERIGFRTHCAISRYLWRNPRV